MTQVPKIPAMIEKALNEFKEDLKQVKEAVEGLKNDLPKMKGNGKECNSKKVEDPVPCYKEIYGPIKYTKKQREEWEGEMQERFSEKHQVFHTEDFPTTDMVDA